MECRTILDKGVVIEIIYVTSRWNWLRSGWSMSLSPLFLNHQLEMKKSENLVGSGTTRWKEPGFLNHHMEGHLLNNISDFGAKKLTSTILSYKIHLLQLLL